MKAYKVLRWTALKFVAAPRKRTVLDPGVVIGNLIKDRRVFWQVLLIENKRTL